MLKTLNNDSIARLIEASIEDKEREYDTTINMIRLEGVRKAVRRKH